MTGDPVTGPNPARSPSPSPEASSGLEAFYGLPQDVKFCRRCVISNQRPNSSIEFQHTRATKKITISFDADGVCDA